MPAEPFDSTRIKISDLNHLRALAEKFNVYAYDVIRAWRDAFDKLPEAEQHATIVNAAIPRPAARPAPRRRTPSRV